MTNYKRFLRKRMTNVEPNYKWVEKQLKATNWLNTPAGDTVISVLKTLEELKYPLEEVPTLDSIFDKVSKLSLGHTIVNDGEENWLDATGGDVNVRDVVRIKPDAYKGRAGERHNGQRGVVTVLRNGLATIVYDGEAVEDASEHNLSAFQKLDVE